MDPRYLVQNVDEIPSPSLLIYREHVEENLARILDIAGGAELLRPHVKTHKMAQMRPVLLICPPPVLPKDLRSKLKFFLYSQCTLQEVNDVK